MPLASRVYMAHVKTILLSAAFVLFCSTAAAGDDTKAQCAGASSGWAAPRQTRRKLLEAQRAFKGVCERCFAPTIVSTDCRRWLADVRAKLPSLVFFLDDAASLPLGQGVAGRSAVTNGAGWSLRAPSIPGRHSPSIQRRGSHRVPSRSSCELGEKGTGVIDVPQPEAAPPSKTAKPAESSTPSSVYVLGGVGAVALVPFSGYFAYSALLENALTCGIRCYPNACPQDDVGRYEGDAS